MKSYCISDHCRLVKGALGSAIYDLRQGKVYAINPQGTQFLTEALLNNSVTEEAVQFLEKIESTGLLNDHSTQIVEKKIRPKLRYVWLELTNRCNCRCLHCYGAFGLPNKKDIEKELSLAEWKNVIDNIYQRGCNAIQFIGGEPLIYPNFNELLKYARDKGIERIDIFTNAYFLSEQTAKLIQQVGASVRISIYGYDAESHDAITQCHGSFKRLEQSIDILQSLNVPITMAVVLMKENQHLLPKIKEYIESKGLKFSGFDTVRTVKHSVQESHAVTDPKLIERRAICCPRFKTSPYSFAMKRQWNSCWYGKFSVTACGDVIPCIFARDLSCGNIRTDSWSTIRENLIHYWSITKDQVGECKDCEFRYACDDCRPLAMGDGDGLYGKYPRCTYLPFECKW